MQGFCMLTRWFHGTLINNLMIKCQELTHIIMKYVQNRDFFRDCYKTWADQKPLGSELRDLHALATAFSISRARKSHNYFNARIFRERKSLPERKFWSLEKERDRERWTKCGRVEKTKDSISALFRKSHMSPRVIS